MNEIKGKVVAITGASSGLGEATARHLAALGAKVVLGARRESKLRTIADEINKVPGSAIFLKTDVTDKDQVRALVDFAVVKYGKLDVFVNNAGLMSIAPLQELKVEEWVWILR